MKTGLTIQQMAQELLRQSKAKQDYLVNTGSLSLSVTSDAPQLRVTENGLDKITPLDIRQTAHRQLGTYLGIPQKYYELMRTDAPELLAYNANYWFSQKNELRTLRTMDGCARAFLSNRYRRIDNLDIASVTLPVIGELPEARFVSTQITDDFMYIKVVNPRLQADVVPGDVVQAGVIISNSETGLGSVTIQPLIYRLVCSNGMVINDAKTRRNHVGRAATSDEDFSIYPDIACPVCGGDVNSWDKRCSRALGYRQIVCEGCISEEYQVTVENLRYVMENHFGLVPCPGI